MAQAAYLCEETFGDAPECAALPQLAISLFGDSDAALAVMTEDAASAGLSVRATRPLEALLEGEAGVLGNVVLVDCPVIDGAKMAALSRLDERALRSGAQLIATTSLDGLDSVFGCLDRSNPQILVAATRAERLVALGNALALMPGRRLREMDESDRTTLLRLTEQVGKLAEKLNYMADGRSQSANSHDDRPTVRLASPTQGFRHEERQDGLARKARPPLPDPRLIKSVIRQRQMRSEFLDGELFADPAWDILLDLTAARAEHRRVSVTSLCIAANVPATTALRWISQMVDVGLLERVQDESDRRRAFIALSDKAADAMARYFDALGKQGPLAI